MFAWDSDEDRRPTPLASTLLILSYLQFNISDLTLIGTCPSKSTWRSDIHLNSIAAGPGTHNREAEEFKEKDPAT
jgi:hypothetical protein